MPQEPKPLKPKITEEWLASIPLLDSLQVGSLRRIFNLAAQLPDDWSGMQGRTALQEDFSGLRFQLAYMSYALALTHVHRLPAAPGLFKQPFESLIEKMLSPDVWTYWHYVGTGNGPFNQALGKLPEQWDPVVKDNIMYSAYLQSMALLYHYLFRDGRYAEEGALTLSVNPLFWDLGGKHFPYDERSLNSHLYWGMVERGYLGIACEPNCVFQICNQPPILGFRFHDLVYGGSTAEEVTQGYLQAWEEFGVLNQSGHFNMMVQEHEREVITLDFLPWTDFWMASMMHAWNPEFVEQQYPTFVKKWVLDAPDGSAWVMPPEPLPTETLERTAAYDFGWAAVCASEVGDDTMLQRMLAYADTHLAPVWRDGAYYYPRCDQRLNAEGRLRGMDPHTGNALLSYARLNVPSGLKKLYDGPLDDEHFSNPKLTGIHPSRDIRRAKFDSSVNALVLTLSPINGDQQAAETALELENVWGRGEWRLDCNGSLVAYGSSDKVDWTSDSILIERNDGVMLIKLDVVGITTLVWSWS